MGPRTLEVWNPEVTLEARNFRSGHRPGGTATRSCCYALPGAHSCLVIASFMSSITMGRCCSVMILRPFPLKKRHSILGEFKIGAEGSGVLAIPGVYVLFRDPIKA